MGVNCARLPDAARVITDRETAVMSRGDTGFTHRDVCIRFEGNNAERIYLTARDSAVRFVALRWRGNWAKGTRFLGDTLERGYGTFAWRGLETENVMCWYFITTDGERQSGFGVKTQPDALCYWTADGAGATLWLDVRNGGAGVLLGGRELFAAQIVTDESDSLNPFRFQQAFCKKLCDRPLLPQSPVYGGNNWCYAYGDSSAAQILGDAALIRDLSQGLENRPFMVIDDGWQELARTNFGGAQGRPYERGNSLFPDMHGLAEDLRAMDVRPGLWMRPLRTGEKYVDQRLLLDRQPGFLDPSLPGTLDLIAGDVARMVGWGYQLIKYDFVERDILGSYFRQYRDVLRTDGWHFKDRSKTSAEIMKDVSRAILAHSGGALLIGCNVAGHLAAGMIHLHRSGDDTSGRDYKRSVQMGVNCLAFRLAQHGAFFGADADCVCLTDKIPWEKNKDLLRLYAMSGTALFVSAQPEAMNGETFAALREAFRVSSAGGGDIEPLDWLDDALPACYNAGGETLRFSWANEEGYDFPLMS